MPTVIVLEEAHNFVQRELSDSDETISAARCRHVFEKVAKEGRKFGVGLVLSSLPNSRRRSSRNATRFSCTAL